MTTTGFQPNLLEDWLDTRPAPPVPPRAIGELDSPDAYVEHIYAMPFIHTPEATQIRRAIEDVQTFNATRSLGARRLVVIDGPAQFGKTTMILQAALSQAQDTWKAQPERRPPSIPWAYVNATSGGEGKSVAAGIAGFCRLPKPTSNPTLAQYLDQLCHTSKALGLHSIFIDDVHALRRFGGKDGRSIADSIKAIVTGLPQTIVVAGIELRSHPLFTDTGRGRVIAAQLLNRSQWVRLRPWPSHDRDGHVHENWLRLIAKVSEYLVLPRGSRQNGLHTKQAIDAVVGGSNGSPGTAIEWLLRAAVWAVRNDHRLDKTALTVTRTSGR